MKMDDCLSGGYRGIWMRSGRRSERRGERWTKNAKKNLREADVEMGKEKVKTEMEGGRKN